MLYTWSLYNGINQCYPNELKKRKKEIADIEEDLNTK